MSSRMWTSGYVFYHPSSSSLVVGHEYGLSMTNSNSNSTNPVVHWESEMNKILGHDGLYNPLKLMMTNRIKFLLQFPEAARDMIKPKSVLVEIEKYGLGSFKTINSYMQYAQLDVLTKSSLGNTIRCENT